MNAVPGGICNGVCSIGVDCDVPLDVAWLLAAFASKNGWKKDRESEKGPHSPRGTCLKGAVASERSDGEIFPGYKTVSAVEVEQRMTFEGVKSCKTTRWPEPKGKSYLGDRLKFKQCHVRSLW